MSGLPLYCRFCASEKPKESLLSIKNNDKFQDSVKDKMLIFRDEIVDFSNESLPDNICKRCFESLNKSHEFFMQAKESQVMLNLIFLNLGYGEKPSPKLLNFDQVKQENNYLDLDNWSDRELEPYIPDESWTSYPWQCPRCETNLASMQDLRTHNQEHHGACLDLQCVDCTETTVGFNEFIKHVTVHRPMLSNYCPYCNIKLESPSHIDTHKHNCSSCGQPFTYKTLLYAHLQDYKSNVSEFFKEKKIKTRSNTIKRNVKSNSKLSLRSAKKLSMNLLNNDADIKTYGTANNDIFNNIPMPPLFDTKLQRFVTTDESKNKLQNSFKDITQEDDLEMNLKNNTTNFETTIQTIKQETIDKIEQWSDYPHICKFCGLNLTSWAVLQVHSISYHKKCFGMKCVDCDDDDSHTLEQFAEHVIKHRPNLINSCPFCYTSVSEADHLYHLQTHKSHFQCTSCGQHFKNMRDFRCHDNKLDPPLLKPPVKRRKLPITDDEVVCDTCNFKAKSPWLLKKHKLIHTSDRKRDFTCEKCGKTFLSKDTLDTHTKLHELHEKEPREICKICSKAFYTVKRLRDHVKNHNLVMPFQCDDCKKHFRSKDSLRSHVIVHMDIKPFSCQYCQKKFKQKKHMQIHEYQHTGARPFSCDICCINFTCWSNCDKHLRRMHGMSLAKATVTPYGKMDIDPATGKPKELSITNDLQDWMKNLIAVTKGRRKKAANNEQRFNET